MLKKACKQFLSGCKAVLTWHLSLVTSQLEHLLCLNFAGQLARNITFSLLSILHVKANSHDVDLLCINWILFAVTVHGIHSALLEHGYNLKAVTNWLQYLWSWKYIDQCKEENVLMLLVTCILRGLGWYVSRVMVSLPAVWAAVGWVCHAWGMYYVVVCCFFWVLYSCATSGTVI